MAAPAKPPISVCEEEEGIPFHQVNRFQAMAAITPARMIGKGMYGVGNAETADDTLGDEKGHKIEESRPYHRLKRCKHFGRHNGGNRIGRIMKTVDIIEYQSQYNDNH